MVDRRRLVVVVVVDVQAGVTPALFGDEVDQFLEGALLARPVERPDLGVPGPAAGVGVGGVDDAEQVLQPELLAVLGVIPGSFDVEEQITGGGFRQRQQATVDQEGPRRVPFGIQDLVPDAALVLAGHLQAGLPPGTFQGWPARCVTAGKDVQGCQRAPGRHPGRLQRPPLVLGDPGDQRQVVVAAPAVFAQVVPAADHAVLHRLRVRIGGRVVARVGGDERAEGAPGLPFVGRVVADLQRDQVAPAERQVHPAGPDALQRGEEVGVERGLRDRARLGASGPAWRPRPRNAARPGAAPHPGLRAGRRAPGSPAAPAAPSLRPGSRPAARPGR